MKPYLEAGEFVTTHGIAGELRLYPWSDTPAFLTHFKTLYLDADGQKPLEIEQLRPHKNICLVKLAGVSSIAEARPYIGKTVWVARADAPLPGYQDPKPMVFSGLFPIDGDDFEDLRDSLAKLKLNDASISYTPESSGALGFGFRCGFLGLLHMEIVQERLEREFDMDLITTAPTVVYEVVLNSGELIRVENPAKLPDVGKYTEIREPIITATIFLPQEYVGPVITLCNQKRGVQIDMRYHGRQVQLIYELPMNEVVMDFFDKLKSFTRGYGTMDYEVVGYRASDLVKVQVLVNKRPVDALSIICHRSEADRRGRRIVQLLRKKIDRHQFVIPIQAAIGSRVIARETVSALRKDVTAKCYGGDITRKRKLLEQQKAGKKRMKAVGNVFIPQQAFMAVLEGEES